MSLIISNPSQIHDAPTNSSTAKQLYSFPKSHRFQDMHHSVSSDKMYTLPESRSHRSTSFGFGKKYDFTAHTKNVPAPGHYNNVDAMYRFKKQGVTISPGRDVQKYRPEAYRKHNPPAYTLQPKHDLGLRGNGVPGPGFYKLGNLFNGTGMHWNSKFKSSLPKLITRPSLAAISAHKDGPGPGSYDLNVMRDSRGLIAGKKSISNIKFSKSPRSTRDSYMETPGPGQYRLPSEFGHYQNKVSYGDQL